MHSQNNEEQIILDYFGSRKGVFADIGANDGITLSNTRALAEREWSGVCVEPSQAAFARLKKNYRGFSGVICYNYAISNTDNGLVFYESGELLDNNDVSLVSSLHEKETQRFRNKVEYNKTFVATRTWKTFIDRCAYKEFDFISIDIEGSEMEALPFIDLSKTSMLCIEFNGNHDLRKEYEKYLSGFDLIHTNAENLIYAR